MKLFQERISSMMLREMKLRGRSILPIARTERSHPERLQLQ